MQSKGAGKLIINKQKKTININKKYYSSFVCSIKKFVKIESSFAKVVEITKYITF